MPFLNTYSIAQNTSYKSTCLGRVFFFAFSDIVLIRSYCPRVMSLSYLCLSIIPSHTQLISI